MKHQFERCRPERMRGVTLIELLTVVVIVAILGALAVSSYRRYMLRANRTDASTTLLRIRLAQEKYFLQNNKYIQTLSGVAASPTATPAGLGVAIDGTTGLTSGGYYLITLTNTSDTTYTATATATAQQTKDTSACLSLSIDQTGARTPTESSGCWR